MSGQALRVDLRAISIGALTVAIASLIALLATAGSDVALERTALVLAVIAFVADLVIALASYLMSIQAEARLVETNGQMQTALAQVDERTDEIRNLMRMQAERLIDMVGRRLVEESPADERPQVQAVLGQLRNRLHDDVVQPPGGGLKGRQATLQEKIHAWAQARGWRAVESPYGGRTEVYESNDADGRLFGLKAFAGRQWRRGAEDWQGLRFNLRDEWPDRPFSLVIVLEDPSLSGWDGDQSFGAAGILIVTEHQLDDVLKAPINR